MKIDCIDDPEQIMRIISQWQKEKKYDLTVGKRRIAALVLVSAKPMLTSTTQLADAIAKLLAENGEMQVQHIINSFEYEFPDAPRCVYGCLYKQPELFTETRKGYWTNNNLESMLDDMEEFALKLLKEKDNG